MNNASRYQCVEEEDGKRRKKKIAQNIMAESRGLLRCHLIFCLPTQQFKVPNRAHLFQCWKLYGRSQATMSVFSVLVGYYRQVLDATKEFFIRVLMSILIFLGYVLLSLFIYAVMRRIMVPQKLHVIPVHLQYKYGTTNRCLIVDLDLAS